MLIKILSQKLQKRKKNAVVSLRLAFVDDITDFQNLNFAIVKYDEK